jgi:hypothetical protein
MTLLKPGDRLRSRACSTEVIVVRAPSIGAEICCGGEPMAKNDAVAAPAAVAAAGEPGTILGKRYADEEAGLELLCVKAGSGQISVDGRLLLLRGARPLPASD